MLLRRGLIPIATFGVCEMMPMYGSNTIIDTPFTIAARELDAPLSLVRSERVNDPPTGWHPVSPATALARPWSVGQWVGGGSVSHGSVSQWVGGSVGRWVGASVTR
jgi:hypothetical protein